MNGRCDIFDTLNDLTSGEETDFYENRCDGSETDLRTPEPKKSTERPVVHGVETINEGPYGGGGDEDFSAGPAGVETICGFNGMQLKVTYQPFAQFSTYYG